MSEDTHLEGADADAYTSTCIQAQWSTQCAVMHLCMMTTRRIVTRDVQHVISKHNDVMLSAKRGKKQVRKRTRSKQTQSTHTRRRMSVVTPTRT